MEHGTDWVGDSWDELKYIRQAVTFLVIGNKPKKTLEDITKDLCPILSIQQLYRISTMYWDDKYNTETVSSEVSSQVMISHKGRGGAWVFHHWFIRRPPQTGMLRFCTICCLGIRHYTEGWLVPLLSGYQALHRGMACCWV